MKYTEKETELLRFCMIGAKNPNDANPPFSEVGILWKGKVVPFVNGILIDAYATTIKRITIYVTSRKGRGHTKDDKNFARIMREMKERNINIVGWPEAGDKT